LLVLRAGQQVGFGPADEMINAVRNLQVVTPNETKERSGPVEDAKYKNEATNDAPVAAPNFSRPNTNPTQPDGNTSGPANPVGPITPNSVP
jgi:hypothetical protein